MTVTIETLNNIKLNKQRFASITCYDSSFAAVAEAAEIEVLLVGDSLGMVIQGHGSTLPVSVSDICYHTKAVASSNTHSLIMADMPFMSARSMKSALDSSMRLMQAGAHMVKLEGGAWLAPIITQLKQQGIPVCAHLGLTPQSLHAFSGYKVQAKTQDAADELMCTAHTLETAGADLILVECIPSLVTEKLQKTLRIPLIGIGAGPACDGQILVVYDMLGIPNGKKPRFVKNYLEEANSIQAALQQYRNEIINRKFPARQHCF